MYIQLIDSVRSDVLVLMCTPLSKSPWETRVGNYYIKVYRMRQRAESETRDKIPSLLAHLIS